MRDVTEATGAHGAEGERHAPHSGQQGGPQPPPSGGMLWEQAGELRALLMLPTELTMQVALPGIGAGVDDHSVFRTDPWGRGERSLRSVQLWVYGDHVEGGEGSGAEEGRRLLRLHRHIKGTDSHGRPYRALDPDLYAWVVASVFPVYVHAQRYLGRRPYTGREEERLYAEWLQVARLLGLRDADLPRTAHEYGPYYRAILRRLEYTKVVDELVGTRIPLPPPDRGPRAVLRVVRPCWPLLRGPFLRFRRFVTIGLMPPDAREAIGLPWTDRQERRLRWFGRAVRVVVPLLPERLRYLPLAYRARAHRRREQRRKAEGAGAGDARPTAAR